MENIFHGLGIALITPMKGDGEVDYEALARLVDYQIENGADFLCILATTGEAPCLTREEKDKITDVILSVNHGRIPILKYCGGNNTRAVIEEIKSTEWTGIDGILSICPYYNKPSQEGLYQHFKAIAQASPLPLVMYNVPGRTGVNMKAATTVRIANDFPNVVAIKEASGSLEQVDDIIKNDDHLGYFPIADFADQDFLMPSDGFDMDILPLFSRSLGKDQPRIRYTNLSDSAIVSMVEHNLGVSLLSLYKLLFVDGNPAGVKSLLNDMGMIENVLRLPLVPTRIETKQKMDEIIKNLKC